MLHHTRSLRYAYAGAPGFFSQRAVQAVYAPPVAGFLQILLDEAHVARVVQAVPDGDGSSRKTAEDRDDVWIDELIVEDREELARLAGRIESDDLPR
jgi:hypothetical protein